MDFTTISPLLLISIGAFLIALEIFIVSFFIIWFGFASIIVGLISYNFDFQSGHYQIITISVLSILLFLVANKSLKNIILKPKEKLGIEEKTKIGIVKNGKIEYDGTFWRYESKDILKDGDKVKIILKNGTKLEVSSV